MRILHLTDTHLGADRRVRGGPPGWRRRDDHFEAFERALHAARVHDVDLVIHSGDVFDRPRPPFDEVVRAARALGELSREVPVVVMPGNHDRMGLKRALPRDEPGLHMVHGWGRLRLCGLTLAVVPYQRSAMVWSMLAQRAWQDGADVLVAHQAFDGAEVPGLTFRSGRQPDTVGEEHLPPSVPWVLCGHLHPRQVVRVGGTVVVHPGSTERTAFSERHDTKGYAIWELGYDVWWRFVDLPSRPMRVVSEPAGLVGVRQGDLVMLTGAARDRGVEHAVLQRGAMLAGAPVGEERGIRETRPVQLGMFGRGVPAPVPRDASHGADSSGQRQ